MAAIAEGAMAAARGVKRAIGVAVPHFRTGGITNIPTMGGSFHKIGAGSSIGSGSSYNSGRTGSTRLSAGSSARPLLGSRSSGSSYGRSSIGTSYGSHSVAPSSFGSRATTRPLASSKGSSTGSYVGGQRYPPSEKGYPTLGSTYKSVYNPGSVRQEAGYGGASVHTNQNRPLPAIPDHTYDTLGSATGSTAAKSVKSSNGGYARLNQDGSVAGSAAGSTKSKKSFGSRMSSLRDGLVGKSGSNTRLRRAVIATRLLSNRNKKGKGQSSGVTQSNSQSVNINSSSTPASSTTVSSNPSTSTAGGMLDRALGGAMMKHFGKFGAQNQHLFKGVGKHVDSRLKFHGLAVRKH